MNNEIRLLSKQKTIPTAIHPSDMKGSKKEKTNLNDYCLISGNICKLLTPFNLNKSHQQNPWKSQ